MTLSPFTDPGSARIRRQERYEAGLAALGASDHDPWDPVDRPAPADAPAELGLDGLDPVALRGSMARHGSLLVRGLLDGDDLRTLQDGADRALSARDAGGEVGWFEPFRCSSDQYLRQLRMFTAATSALLLIDSPILLELVLDVLDRRGVTGLVTEHLGERPALGAMKCVVRRVEGSSPGDWHQDGAFLTGVTRSVNVWMALTDCGSDAPGIDIVPRRLDDLVPTGTAGAHFDWSVGDPEARAAAGTTGILTPEFTAGDALLFDHLMLHRTSGRPDTRDIRRAIEFWLFAPSSYPEGEVPLLV